jgi:nitrous oxidase accessory protein NosD
MENQEISVKTIKKYKNKDGVEQVKVYNQKIYNDRYYKNNINKFKDTYHCDFCNKNVLKSNKHNHEQTKKHVLQSKYNIDLKNL